MRGFGSILSHNNMILDSGKQPRANSSPDWCVGRLQKQVDKLKAQLAEKQTQLMEQQTVGVVPVCLGQG
jgi:hypothetical protein